MNILDEAYELTDDEGNTFKKDTAALKKYFDIFNQDYFDGKLAPIELVWFSAKKLHGYFRPHFVMDEKRTEGVKIGLNMNACGTFAAFRNTFVHEMLHYYVDVYIGLPDVNWEAAKHYAKTGSRELCRKALRNTQETCHGFEWGRLAKEMSENYLELGNIETYAIPNSETGVALYDKAFVVNWCKKNVILRHTWNGKSGVHCVSVNNADWAKLQEYLAKGTGPSRFKGKWERLWPVLDNQNFKLLRTRNFDEYYWPELFEGNGKYASLIRKVVDLGTISESALSNTDEKLNMIREDNNKYDYYLVNHREIIKIAKDSPVELKLRRYMMSGKGTFGFYGTVQLCDKHFTPDTWIKLQSNRELTSGFYNIRRPEYAAMFSKCEWGHEYNIEQTMPTATVGKLVPAYRFEDK